MPHYGWTRPGSRLRLQNGRPCRKASSSSVRFPITRKTCSHAQLEQQLEGAEALVCLIDFDKNKDLAVQTANQPPALAQRHDGADCRSPATRIPASSCRRCGPVAASISPNRCRPINCRTCLQKLRARWLSSPLRPGPGSGPGPGLSGRKRRRGEHDRGRSSGDVSGPAARPEGADRGPASPPRTRGLAAGHGLAPLQLPRAAAQRLAARPHPVEQLRCPSFQRRRCAVCRLTR